MVELGEITKIITKGTTPTTNWYKFETEWVNFIKVESISENGSVDVKKLSHISKACHESLKRSQLEENDILFSIAGTKMWISAIVCKDVLPANTNQALAIIRLKDEISPKFILNYLNSQKVLLHIESIKIGVAQFNLSLQQISGLKVPLPSLEIQQQIVAEIEKEQAMVESAKGLMDVFEEKVKEKIGEVWGE